MQSNEKLVEIYQSGNKEVVSELIDNNIGLINKLVNKYDFIWRTLKMVEREDLVQEAYLGIIEAAENFNIEEGVKFMTYAPYHIKKNLCRILGGSDKEKNNIKLNNQAKSLDAPITDKEGNEVASIDLVEDKEAIQPFELTEDRIYREKLRNDLKIAFEKNIEGKSKEIILYRYRLNESVRGEVRTYTEVSEKFNLSISRVQQLENKALIKIRRTKWYKDSKENYNIKSFNEIGDYKQLYDIKSMINTYDVIEKVYQEKNKKTDFKNYIVSKYLKGF